MSNQTEQEKQQTMTPEELHQPLQAELDAIRQAIEALSDEQLKAITGGAGGGKCCNPEWEGVKLRFGLAREENKSVWESTRIALKEGPALGTQIHKVAGMHDSEQMREWMKQKGVNANGVGSGSSK